MTTKEMSSKSNPKRIMKPGSCYDIGCAEAAAPTPHPSQTWPLAFTVSRLD
jgi:hypothetical protein